MTEDEIKQERYYEALESDYFEEAKVPLTDYNDLKKKYEKLKGQVADIISFIQDNDPAGAYEYAVGEGLV